MENLSKSPTLGEQLAKIDDWELQNIEFGGVAVWELPHAIAPAYNPILFRRKKYYIAEGDYYPDAFTCFLDFIAPDEIEWLNEANADVYVQYLSNDTDEVVVGTIRKGDTSAILGDDIAKIFGVSLSEDGPFTPYLKVGNYYYITPTNDNPNMTDAEMRWAVVDDGYLLTTPEGYRLYANNEVESASIEIHNPNTKEVATLSGVSFNNTLCFDVAPIVRAWMGNELPNTSEENPVVISNALFVAFEVREPFIYDIPPVFVALNAVKQIGERTDMADRVGKALTTKPMLTYYAGYPLDYSVLADDEVVATPNGTIAPYSVGRVFVLEGRLLLLTEDGTPILTEDGENIYLYGNTPNGVLNGGPIKVVERCVPSAPFYVRWINTEGGVDYWMFHYTQERSLAVSNVERAMVYVPNPAVATTNERTLSFATKNTIKVGASGVKGGDFDALRKLPLSPLVEWWNEKTQAWVRLNVESFELNFGTRQPLHDVEITFALPALYTQQAVWQ